MEQVFPKRRQQGLVVRALPTEVLIYDTERHEAHCLNRPAALVWEQCDGLTPPVEIACKVAVILAAAIDEDVVLHALDQLETFHLLEAESPARPSFARISRRELIQRLGLAASVVLPLVSSIAAPVAAQAASGDGSASGSTGATVSDRNLKTGFAPVDVRAILARVAALPITTWSYKGDDPGIRHLGPMAQDFAAAFQVGADDRHIHMVDASGVALSAIQALLELVQAQQGRLAFAERELAALQAEQRAVWAELRSLATPSRPSETAAHAPGS
jgi:hypothetical protein